MTNIDILIGLLSPEELAVLIEILQNERWLRAVLTGHIAQKKARKNSGGG